jgi:iron(III) transport system substrate-binding protein
MNIRASDNSGNSRSSCSSHIGLSTFFGLALLGLMSTGCTSDDRTSLIVYSPHGKEMLRAYEDAFELEHPEIDVRWIDMGGQDAYDRIRTEHRNPQASLWWGGDGPTFSRAAAEGLLEPYEPTWASAVDTLGRGVDHSWYATYLTPEVILFNTRNVAVEERPSTWDDLLDEKWRDRIIIRYPLASSTMRTIWGALIMRQETEEDGYAWLARLDRNTKTYASDPTQLYLKVAREEGDITLWNMPDTYIQTEMHKYPFGFVIPSDGTPVLNDAIALVKGGPQLAAAQQFYEFVTTKEALINQAHTYFRIPARTDLDHTSLPDWIANAQINAMDVDWAKLTAEGAGWMTYWDEHIKGRGQVWLTERSLD